MTAATKASPKASFEASRVRFETLLDVLEKTPVIPHNELETFLHAQGHELLRVLFQDKLNLDALLEPRIEGVVDAKGVPLTASRRTTNAR